MTTFSVEVMLKGRDAVAIEQAVVPHGAPGTWDEAAVRDVLIETLRAIDRAQNPNASRDRPVVLTGFSWIVEPVGAQVMLALEIPMGAAAAGPFAIEQKQLDALVSSVIRQERARLSPASTVH